MKPRSQDGEGLLGLGGDRKVRAFEAKENREDTLLIAGLFADGHLPLVIDRTYDLAAAPDDIRYLQQGHTRGKAGVTPHPGAST